MTSTVKGSRRSLLGAWLRGCLVGLGLLAIVVGCAGPQGGRSPYAPLSDAERQTTVAERLSREAADLVHTRPDQAEKLLRQALAADLYYGPAHNNLGVLYLKQGRLFEAADEFEWARRLMPGSADPRTNLALVFEQAGRVDDALAAYASALEVQPEHLPALQGLTKLQVRHRREDDRTVERLQQIALRGDERWRAWAGAVVNRQSVDHE